MDKETLLVILAPFADMRSSDRETWQAALAAAATQISEAEEVEARAILKSMFIDPHRPGEVEVEVPGAHGVFRY